MTARKGRALVSSCSRLVVRRTEGTARPRRPHVRSPQADGDGDSEERETDRPSPAVAERSAWKRRTHDEARIGGPSGNGRSPTRLRPEIRRDYPLNLSILISGGKETNQDSPSNGE
jgi:hypothetical protein